MIFRDHYLVEVSFTCYRFDSRLVAAIPHFARGKLEPVAKTRRASEATNRLCRQLAQRAMRNGVAIGCAKGNFRHRKADVS